MKKTAKTIKTKKIKPNFYIFDKNRPVIVIDTECYAPNYGGCFALLHNPDKYTKYNCVNIESSYSCREDFHDCYNYFDENKKQFLFNHKSGGFNNLVKFINLIENKLKLTKSSKLKFKSIRPEYCLVELSNWWSTPLRFAFLTILLRAGMYYVNSIEKAINSQDYFVKTKEAVNLFLEGYTSLRLVNKSKKEEFADMNKIKGGLEYGGWYNTFGEIGSTEIKKILRKI